MSEVLGDELWCFDSLREARDCPVFLRVEVWCVVLEVHYHSEQGFEGWFVECHVVLLWFDTKRNSGESTLAPLSEKTDADKLSATIKHRVALW